MRVMKRDKRDWNGATPSSESGGEYEAECEGEYEDWARMRNRGERGERSDCPGAGVGKGVGNISEMVESVVIVGRTRKARKISPFMLQLKATKRRMTIGRSSARGRSERFIVDRRRVERGMSDPVGQTNGTDGERGSTRRVVNAGMERTVELKDVVRDQGRERREEIVGRERMVVRPDDGWRTSWRRRGQRWPTGGNKRYGLG